MTRTTTTHELSWRGDTLYVMEKLNIAPAHFHSPQSVSCQTRVLFLVGLRFSCWDRDKYRSSCGAFVGTLIQNKRKKRLDCCTCVIARVNIFWVWMHSVTLEKAYSTAFHRLLFSMRGYNL